MSPLIANATVMALFVVSALLVFWTVASPRFARPTALTAILAFVLLGVYHTGGLGRPDPEWFAAIPATEAEEGVRGCEEAIALLLDNKVLARRSETEVTVQQSIWNTLPQPSREAMGQCIQTVMGDGRSEVRIVEVDG